MRLLRYLTRYLNTTTPPRQRPKIYRSHMVMVIRGFPQYSGNNPRTAWACSYMANTWALKVAPLSLLWGIWHVLYRYLDPLGGPVPADSMLTADPRLVSVKSAGAAPLPGFPQLLESPPDARLARHMNTYRQIDVRIYMYTCISIYNYYIYRHAACT